MQLATGGGVGVGGGGGLLAMPASLINPQGGGSSQLQLLALVMQKTRLKEHAAKELLLMCEFNLDETLKKFQYFQQEGLVLPESLQ